MSMVTLEVSDPLPRNIGGELRRHLSRNVCYGLAWVALEASDPIGNSMFGHRVITEPVARAQGAIG